MSRRPHPLCGHVHDNATQQIACDTAYILTQTTGFASIVVINSSAEGDPDKSDAAAAVIGNATDLANMIAATLDLLDSVKRPTNCVACMANYDALIRARAALGDIVGSC